MTNGPPAPRGPQPIWFDFGPSLPSGTALQGEPGCVGSPLQTPPLRQRAPRGGLAAHWALAGAVGRRHPEQAVPSADAEPWAPGGGRRRGLWGPAEPTASACGPRQRGFLTGLPSLSGPQTIDYPCTAASGSSPGLGWGSKVGKPLCPRPALPLLSGRLEVGRQGGGPARPLGAPCPSPGPQRWLPVWSRSTRLVPPRDPCCWVAQGGAPSSVGPGRAWGSPHCLRGQGWGVGRSLQAHEQSWGSIFTLDVQPGPLCPQELCPQGGQACAWEGVAGGEVWPEGRGQRRGGGQLGEGPAGGGAGRGGRCCTRTPAPSPRQRNPAPSVSHC